MHCISGGCEYYGDCLDDEECDQCEICGGCYCKHVGCDPPCENPCGCPKSADPVFIKNGEYVLSVTDVHIPGRTLPVEITRTYNSRRSFNSRFGYGWDMNYNMRVYWPNQGTTIYFVDGKGGRYGYTRDQYNPNKYTRSSAPGDYFIYDTASGTFTLFKRNKTELAFDVNENISSIMDKNRNRILFTYNENEFLTKITDDLNRDIILSYDSFGMLETITDFSGRIWTYTYDANDDLLVVKGPNSPPDYPYGLSVMYLYDNNHNLEYIYDANERLAVRNYYNASDMVETQTVGDGNYVWNYNYAPNTVAIWDREGYRTEMVYGTSGQLLNETIFADDNDPNFKTTYVYNSNLQKIREIFPSGSYNTYNYDSQGNLLTLCREPNNGDPNILTTYTYEENSDFVKTATDGKGNTTTFYYDGALDFNGASDYVNAGSDSSLESASFTITAWIKPDNVSSLQQVAGKYGFHPTGNCAYGYRLEVSANGKASFNVDPSECGNTNVLSSTTTLQTGNWYFLTGTYNGTTAKIYVNGQQENSGTRTLDACYTNFFIGVTYSDYSSTYQQYFDGVIDDVRYYNKVLSATEIRSLYITGDNDSNLVSRWKLEDDANNTTVEDCIGSNEGTSSRNTELMHTFGRICGEPVKIIYPAVSAGQPTVRFTYNIYGQVTSVADPCGIITEFEYGSDVNDANNYGRLTKVVVDASSLQITTNYKYDAFGSVIEVNDPNRFITCYAYDALIQLDKITDPCSNITKFSYDENGNRKKIEREISGEPNQITRFAYNVLNNLMKITDPCGYDTVFSYNKNEEPNLIHDAEDHNTVSLYNERDLLWKVTDANGKITEYSYDKNGNLAEIKDANNDTTTYEYDGFYRLIEISYPDDSNEKFTYDKNSNVTSKKNRNGQTIYYEYDALNRLSVKNRSDDPNITFTYDIASRVVEVNDGRSVSEGGGITRYEYDRVGRLTKVTDPEGRIVIYEYDKRGLRTKVDVPGPPYLTYTYDALGRVTKVTHSNTSFGNNGVLAEYRYDQFSRRTLLTLGNDTNSVYEYDIADKLEKITNNLNGSGLGSFGYTYDKVENRLTMTDSNSNLHEYTYDKLYQLTEVNYPDNYIHDVVTYNYDALGNRKSVVNGGTTNYSRNSLNQYTRVGPEYYYYDLNGNLIVDGTYIYYYDCENRLTDVNDNSTGNRVASYKYDFAGHRVKKIIYGTPNVVRKYNYDGDQIIGEYDVNGVILRRFYYGPNIDEPICIHRTLLGGGLGLFYYHYDGLGSVVAITNDSKQVIEAYEYDVYGAPVIWDMNSHLMIESSLVGNSYLFTGREYDVETGNYYYRARYYHPRLGRFLQPDPIGYFNLILPLVKNSGKETYPELSASGGLSAIKRFLNAGPMGRFLLEDTPFIFLHSFDTINYTELNLYRYTYNNPTNYNDPSGLKGISCSVCIGCLTGAYISCYISCSGDDCVDDVWSCTNDCFNDLANIKKWKYKSKRITAVKWACAAACVACATIGP
jgi:RHS repeat-associated protein